METTIIKLDGNPSDSSMVVRSATFEEAFGDYSEARGKGRARRQARKLDRQEKKAERKVARQTTKQAKIGAKQETRQLRRGGRQEGRIGRRATRKDLRQAMRTEQQADRMGRRGARLDTRQQREDARQMREDTRVQGDEARQNYMAEQEAYRESLQPQEEGQGGYAPQGGEDQGGYAPQGGGGYEDQGGYAPQGGGGSQDDWGSAPSGYYDESEDQDYGYEETPSEGAYGDDNTYEGDYIQEEDEFGDDSYFNVEGMDGKSIVTPYVKVTAQKLKNNSRAYNVLKAKRDSASANSNQTRGLDNLMDRTRTRIIELKSNLDSYCNADGNPTEMKRRRKEVNLALGRRLRRRNRVNQYAGSEVPVESDLSPEFSPNRIEVPPTSSFDAYSDLGRPVIVDGQTMSDASDYTDDIMGDFEPTTIEMQSSFDGGSSNKNVIMSVAIGVGVGALALYLAKRQGWI
jgi:hypothetical protein